MTDWMQSCWNAREVSGRGSAPPCRSSPWEGVRRPVDPAPSGVRAALPPGVRARALPGVREGVAAASRAPPKRASAAAPPSDLARLRGAGCLPGGSCVPGWSAAAGCSCVCAGWWWCEERCGQPPALGRSSSAHARRCAGGVGERGGEGGGSGGPWGLVGPDDAGVRLGPRRPPRPGPEGATSPTRLDGATGGWAPPHLRRSGGERSGLDALAELVELVGRPRRKRPAPRRRHPRGGPPSRAP